MACQHAYLPAVEVLEPARRANSTALSGTGSELLSRSRAAMRLLTLASDSATLQPLQPLQEVV